MMGLLTPLIIHETVPLSINKVMEKCFYTGFGGSHDDLNVRAGKNRTH